MLAILNIRYCPTNVFCDNKGKLTAKASFKDVEVKYLKYTGFRQVLSCTFKLSMDSSSVSRGGLQVSQSMFKLCLNVVNKN